MAVDFDRDRMEAVLDAHERWWRGELDRPLVKVVLEKDLPGCARSARRTATRWTARPRRSSTRSTGSSAAAPSSATPSRWWTLRPSGRGCSRRCAAPGWTTPPAASGSSRTRSARSRRSPSATTRKTPGRAASRTSTAPGWPSGRERCSWACRTWAACWTWWRPSAGARTCCWTSTTRREEVLRLRRRRRTRGTRRLTTSARCSRPSAERRIGPAWPAASPPTSPSATSAT